MAALRKQEPVKITIAVPVSAAETCEEFQSLVEEVICLYTPEPFIAAANPGRARMARSACLLSWIRSRTMLGADGMRVPGGFASLH